MKRKINIEGVPLLDKIIEQANIPRNKIPFNKFPNTIISCNFLFFYFNNLMKKAYLRNIENNLYKYTINASKI